MNPSSIALLIVALLMASASPDVERIDVLIDGSHGAAVTDSSVIVVDGALDIGDGQLIDGSIYVVGGRVVIGGIVDQDIVQFAGTLDIESTAEIRGELRHIAGNVEIDRGASIASRAELADSRGPIGPGSTVPTVLAAGFLAAIGAATARRRPVPLSNIGAAAIEHPVVTLTVGSLMTVTFLAVFVFMAFTLVLVPIALLGIAVGVATVLFGLIALGSAVGGRLPIQRDATATAVGVAVVVLSLPLIGLIPVVGDWIALSTILIATGAVIVTYFGATRFSVETLPGLSGGESDS